MKVDFNNLRLAACNDVDRLIRFLNENQDSDGDVFFPMRDILNIITALKSDVVAIACTFDKNSDEFKDLSNDIKITELQYEEDDDEDEW